jgi:methionyl-tRNA formyltransferase
VILNNVLLLAAYTARSQAYAQALAHHELTPRWAVLYGEERGGMPGQKTFSQSSVTQFGGMYIPDLSETLNDTCIKNGWNVDAIHSTDINADEIYQKIKALDPQLVIYSGYGAQIVGSPLLELGAPFLHMHAGWLPSYRGSTTVYYSLLNDRNCGVSAILLNKKIDEGPIVGRRNYPPPPEGIDIDYLYDGVIRANLLVSVLQEYIENEKFSDMCYQDVNEGYTYYVIHPVLKHLAILSLSSDK